MRFVAVKSVEQQDIQAAHRIRAEFRASQRINPSGRAKKKGPGFGAL